MKTILYATLLACIFCLSATAQLIDPDPSEPNAQYMAELRFAMNEIGVGVIPPPVGWFCELEHFWVSGIPFTWAYCEPDPFLVDEQQQEFDEWVRELPLRARERRN